MVRGVSVTASVLSIESSMSMSRRPLFAVSLAFVAAIAAVVVLRAGQAQIPPGPSVRVSDGWYHLDDCSIAVGRQAPSMPLSEALRRSQRPCPICEPLLHQPEWAEFVKAHGETIAAEVKAKAEADAAEAKRKLDAEEAERVRRLKELEDERKRKETAPVVRLTEAQARDIATAASADANGDPAQFQSRFRARVREVAPEYAGPQIVYGSAVLKIFAAGPVARFEASAIESTPAAAADHRRGVGAGRGDHRVTGDCRGAGHQASRRSTDRRAPARRRGNGGHGVGEHAGAPKAARCARERQPDQRRRRRVSAVGVRARRGRRAFGSSRCPRPAPRLNKTFTLMALRAIQ